MKVAVIGLGFGDEGKGLTTSFLSSLYPGAFVARFNGGQQAGHTVVHGDKTHVFSSFGSGTLQGASTYFSPYCTLYPTSWVREFNVLQSKGVTDIKMYVDPLTMITTPYDVKHNRLMKSEGNGTTGMGFGDTIARNEAHYKLYYQDIFYPSIFEAKLNSIKKYYKAIDRNIDLEEFYNSIDVLKDHSISCDLKTLTRNHSNVIFEGAQGVLLDMDFGIFPNVTRSNTTTKNISLMGVKLDEVYYCTRTYQTRHGAGWMSNEEAPTLENNENETNKYNDFQGNFRTGQLDPELLRYALDCDSKFLSKKTKKNLVLTCYDQYPIGVSGLLKKLTPHRFENVYISYGPSFTDIKKLK